VPNHILWVESRPKSPEREDEFNVWHNHFQLQQVLKTPGIVAATRYRLSHLQMEWFPPSAITPAWPYGKQFTYLTLFEFDAVADPARVFAHLRDGETSRLSHDPDNDPVEWGEQWFYEAFTEREVSVWQRPEGPAPERPDGHPNHIFVVPISPLSPEVEDDFNRWYIAQGNIRRHGIAAGTRYRLSGTQGSIDSRAPAPSGEWPFGQHSYLMIYELYDAVAAYNDLRAGVFGPRPADGAGRNSWQAPWGSLRRVDEHIVYEPVTHRVTPAWIKR
jgi:hypothetical protein